MTNYLNAKHADISLHIIIILTMMNLFIVMYMKKIVGAIIKITLLFT